MSAIKSDLLSHPLIRGYFGEQPTVGATIYLTQNEMALAVLQSMQEPIRKGERYLFWSIDYPGQWVEQTQTSDIDEFHPFKLRLPDRFQKQECECICHNSKENHNCCPDMNHSKTTPAPEIPQPWKAFVESKPKDEFNAYKAVEEKIEQICMSHGAYSGGWEFELRELVELARKK